MNEHHYFKDVTLLITHYNRWRSLERLLNSLEKLNCKFEDIVVSDDASRPEHLDEVKRMQSTYNYRLITTPKNGGYGNCINKGMDQIHTPYTLYLQEDFVPFDIFPQNFEHALTIMNEDQSVDYIRFWAIGEQHIDLKPYKWGFSEMVFKFSNPHHLKFYQFSDTPNIKRSTFTEKFGRYREGIHGDLTDYYMAISFLHNKGKGLFYDKYDTLFAHDNSDEASVSRPLTHWKQSTSLPIRLMRFFFLRYKWMKGTWLVLFLKKNVHSLILALSLLSDWLPLEEIADIDLPFI